MNQLPIEHDAYAFLYSIYIAARDFLTDGPRNEFYRLQLERAVGAYGDFEQRLGKQNVRLIEASLEDAKSPKDGGWNY